jgi:c-di-AMP phosphodiesterase-like protein
VNNTGERSFGLRRVKKDGEIYLNAEDLIEFIQTHKESMITALTRKNKASYVTQGYQIAHDHIIDIITIEKSFAERFEKEIRE